MKEEKEEEKNLFCQTSNRNGTNRNLTATPHNHQINVTKTWQAARKRHMLIKIGHLSHLVNIEMHAATTSSVVGKKRRMSKKLHFSSPDIGKFLTVEIVLRIPKDFHFEFSESCVKK